MDIEEVETGMDIEEVDAPPEEQCFGEDQPILLMHSILSGQQQVVERLHALEVEQKRQGDLLQSMKARNAFTRPLREIQSILSGQQQVVARLHALEVEQERQGDLLQSMKADITVGSPLSGQQDTSDGAAEVDGWECGPEQPRTRTRLIGADGNPTTSVRGLTDVVLVEVFDSVYSKTSSLQHALVCKDWLRLVKRSQKELVLKPAEPLNAKQLFECLNFFTPLSELDAPGKGVGKARARQDLQTGSALDRDSGVMSRDPEKDRELELPLLRLDIHDGGVDFTGGCQEILSGLSVHCPKLERLRFFQDVAWCKAEDLQEFPAALSAFIASLSSLTTLELPILMRQDAGPKPVLQDSLVIPREMSEPHKSLRSLGLGFESLRSLGVGFDEDSDVGRLPDRIGEYFPELRSLNLHSVWLTEAGCISMQSTLTSLALHYPPKNLRDHLAALASLSCLRCLSLEGVSTIPPMVGSLTGLQELWLKDIRGSPQEMADVWRFVQSRPQLTEVYLLECNIEGFRASTLSTLTRLRKLCITACEGLDHPLCVWQLTSLSELRVRETYPSWSFRGGPDIITGLDDCVSLRVLVLDCTGWRRSAIPSLIQLKFLRHVAFYSCVEAHIASLRGLTSIVHLEIGRRTTSIIPATIASLPQPKVLKLDVIKLNGGAGWTRLDKLRHLQLSNFSHIKEGCLESMLSITSLRTLVLDKSPGFEVVRDILGAIPSLKEVVVKDDIFL